MKIPALTISMGLVLQLLLMPVNVQAQSQVADGAESQAESSAVVMNTGIFGMCFPDQNNGWLVGKNGTIVHTADGGKSWSLQDSGCPDSTVTPWGIP